MAKTLKPSEWENLAKLLAQRLCYQADVCEHPPQGEPCCLDRQAYLEFVAVTGIDYRPDFSGSSISIWKVLRESEGNAEDISSE